MSKTAKKWEDDQSENPVEICTLFLNYVHEFPLPKEVKSRVNLDDLKVSDIDMSRLRITNKPTCHETDASEHKTPLIPNGLPQQPATNTMKKGLKSHVIFSSTFVNNTGETQTNHLRTERRTTASCRISVHKSVTKEGNFTLQISPPGSILEANGGFRREIQMGKERERVFEEELVWSLDTEVVVPPGCRTRAELVISEDEYDGRFTVETIFEGSVSIPLRDKRDGSLVYLLSINDLSRVLTPEHGFRTLKHPPGAVGFTNQGCCHCHFGISQEVELHQEKL